ncbi:MAG: T9SS type A sorting domain-containing protein [Bacteroidota bacterium]
MKRFIPFPLAAFLLHAAFFVCLPSNLNAEGTAQLMPAGSASSCISYIQGNDGSGKEGSTFGRPSTDYIYVHIANPSVERIFYGFTRLQPSSKSLYYKITDPNGTVISSGRVPETSEDAGYIANDGVQAYAGPKQLLDDFQAEDGYQAISCTPTVAGDYSITFNVGDPDEPNDLSQRYYIHPFDVTVADYTDEEEPVVKTGRLFSRKWHLNTNSGSNQACMNFYAWTPDSTVVLMEMNEIQPFGYSVSFNQYGADSTGNLEEDRKSRTKVNSVVPQYPIFLNEPDSILFPTGTPGTLEFVQFNGCITGEEYCIFVGADRTGIVNVFIDVDSNGVFDPDSVDVGFPYELTHAGETCIPWDGLDGQGNPLPPGTSGAVTVEFLAAVLHFPIWDPENHQQGFNFSIIRPSGLPIPRMFWDNTATPINTQNLTGCFANCNIWDGGKGNNVMVNTWLHSVSSRITLPYVIEEICPPEPKNDTTCVLFNNSVQVEILNNDVPGTFALDPSSIQLAGLDRSLGRADYDSKSQLLSFSVAENIEAQSVTLTYRLCDTSTYYGGNPLCRPATIKVEVRDECPNLYPLEPKNFVLETWENNHLTWQRPAEMRVEEFQIEKSHDGLAFKLCGQLPSQMDIDENRRYEFKDPERDPFDQRQPHYRISVKTPNGQLLRSNQVQFIPISQKPGSINHLQAFPNPAAKTLNIRYQADPSSPAELIVFGMNGQKVYQSALNSLAHTNQVELDIQQWARGIYRILLRTGLETAIVSVHVQ